MSDSRDDLPPGIIFGRNDDLTPRELEIAQYLPLGASNKLIARVTGITEATVKVHIKSILRKLGFDNRTQATMWWIDNEERVAPLIPEEFKLSPTAVNYGLATIQNTGQSLSSQEKRILDLLETGAINKKIAEDLGIVEATVKVHLRNLFRKMGAANRTAAAALSRRQKIAVQTGRMPQPETPADSQRTSVPEAETQPGTPEQPPGISDTALASVRDLIESTGLNLDLLGAAIRDPDHPDLLQQVADFIGIAPDQLLALTAGTAASPQPVEDTLFPELRADPNKLREEIGQLRREIQGRQHEMTATLVRLDDPEIDQKIMDQIVDKRTADEITANLQSNARTWEISRGAAYILIFDLIKQFKAAADEELVRSQSLLERGRPSVSRNMLMQWLSASFEALRRRRVIERNIRSAYRQNNEISPVNAETTFQQLTEDAQNLHILRISRVQLVDAEDNVSQIEAIALHIGEPPRNVERRLEAAKDWAVSRFLRRTYEPC